MIAETSPRHILVVSCLIRNPADEVLLVRHYKRGWEIPQGRVENGETLVAALHREVLEETGLRIQAARLRTVWSKRSEPSAVIFCFAAEHQDGIPRPSEETPELAWFSIDRARSQVVHAVNRDRLQDLLEPDLTLRFRSYRTGPYQLLD